MQVTYEVNSFENNISISRAFLSCQLEFKHVRNMPQVRLFFFVKQLNYFHIALTSKNKTINICTDIF